MKKTLTRTVIAALLAAAWPAAAMAHFPWLDVTGRQSDKPVVQCYFAEAPTDDDPALLKYVADASVYRLAGKDDPVQLEKTDAENQLAYQIEADQAESIFALNHELGVMDRGDTSFLIHYYSVTGPSLKSWAWNRAKGLNDIVALTVVPSVEEAELTVEVSYEGKPVEGAEVYFVHDLAEMDPQKTDENGKARVDISEQTVHAVRVKYVQPGAGEHDGKKYDEARHYTTVTFPEIGYQKLPVNTPYASIPETVTSFGAAASDGVLYVYGGHMGGAHSYSTDGQANTLWALNLDGRSEWKSLAKGPHLQGLAMVAHDGKLYRIGGFTAKNKEGEDHDLWSQDSFASFDPATGKWTDLPALPEPRSSFDAAVLDGKIYVIGGWSLEGEGENEWHKTAWTFDLNDKNAEWKQLPSPPFEKRALSVAVYNGKVYAIGGMQSSGKPTTSVSIYDPKSQTWTEGPHLVGHSMTGFGTSAFAAEGRLYVSTYDGNLQVLSEDGKSFDVVGNFENARFFHRMVPVDSKLILLGGANMSVGKFDQIDEFDLNALSKN
ncbi:Kelch repeat-containing protein [Rubinisphaera margarita]|uniref:Kelch repeat-containing protein n=1 Tax=Rubinisphaera margarita TaxID=2909586 RepID=UPI001EE8A8B1|nr:DUF4198 domain-containing protein [Rubinisphaera margarita]MCG6154560.1 DUF4198 domain-containing protein [Rubinisphaera margarita]